MLEGTAEEEAEVEEGRSEEDAAAEEETAVSFHMLEVEGSAEAEELANDALEVALLLVEADWEAPEALVVVTCIELVSAEAEAEALAMLEGGAEASVRDSEYEEEEVASEADPEGAKEEAVPEDEAEE